MVFALIGTTQSWMEFYYCQTQLIRNEEQNGQKDNWIERGRERESKLNLACETGSLSKIKGKGNFVNCQLYKLLDILGCHLMNLYYTRLGPI